MTVSMPQLMGKPPELAGCTCTGLVLAEYWYQGRLCAPANVLWVRADEQWHRVCIDTGIVFWRNGAPDQIPDEPEYGYSWPLVDIGKARGLEGLMISRYVMSEDAGEVRIAFEFSNGQQFVLVHRDDVTSYAG